MQSESKRSATHPLSFDAVLGASVSLIVLIISIGCTPEIPKEEPPETVPVTGKVIGRDGRPLENAVVDFRPVKGKAWTSIGRTAADGSFSLETLVNGEKLPGAVVGDHRVSVTPPFTDDPEQSAAMPYQERRPLAVKADGENVFTIDMRK